MLVAYLVMPVDLVPDVIPVAGQLDDVLLAAFVLRRALSGAPPGVLAEHWPGPPAGLRALTRVAGA